MLEFVDNARVKSTLQLRTGQINSTAIITLDESLDDLIVSHTHTCAFGLRGPSGNPKFCISALSPFVEINVPLESFPVVRSTLSPAALNRDKKAIDSVPGYVPSMWTHVRFVQLVP